MVSFQGIGDKSLATQCLRLALVANNDHAESYNNLGVIEGTKGNLDQVRKIFLILFYIFIILNLCIYIFCTIL